MTVSASQRFSSSFSDFITRYTAISSTNIRTQIAEYSALESDDGLTMNLGVNPLLQFGLEETRKSLLANILNDLSVIQYVPFDSDTIGNPALDLGDVLIFSGGHADESQFSCVTGYQIKINGKHSLKCVGKNPGLAQAKSKNDKNISGLLNQIEAGKIGIHTFTNASEYTINNTDVKIIHIDFAAGEETHVQFFAIVVIDVLTELTEQKGKAEGIIIVPVPVQNGDGSMGTEDIQVNVELPVAFPVESKAVVSVKYEFNDEEILIHQPVETWGSGKHILPLYYPIEKLIPNFTNTFNAYIRISGGSGTVLAGDCIASISGQGMAAKLAWDGTIEIEDTISEINWGTKWNLPVLTDSMSYQTMEEMKRQMNDSIGLIAIGAFMKPVKLG